MPVAVGLHMSANDVTELIAWQLADALEKYAQEMIKRPHLAKIANSAFRRATPLRQHREISPKDRYALRQRNSRTTAIAIGSEMETRNQIIKRAARCITRKREEMMVRVLSKRALTAAVRCARIFNLKTRRRTRKQ